MSHVACVESKADGTICFSQDWDVSQYSRLNTMAQLQPIRLRCFSDNFYGYGYGEFAPAMRPGLRPTMMTNSCPRGIPDFAQNEGRVGTAGEAGRRGPTARVAPVTRVRQEFPEAWIWTETLARYK